MLAKDLCHILPGITSKSQSLGIFSIAFCSFREQNSADAFYLFDFDFWYVWSHHAHELSKIWCAYCVIALFQIRGLTLLEWMGSILWVLINFCQTPNRLMLAVSWVKWYKIISAHFSFQHRKCCSNVRDIFVLFIWSPIYFKTLCQV